MQDQLYDRDFYLWVEQMAIAVRNRDLETMDWGNLLEEIEDIGKSEKRSLESYLERLAEPMVRTKLSSNSSVITKVRVIGMGFN